MGMHWKSSNTFFEKSGFSGRDFLGSLLFPPVKMYTAHGTSHIVPSSHMSSIYTTVGLHCWKGMGTWSKGGVSRSTCT